MSPRIPGGGFKRKLISLARDLARKPRDVEHAIVVFEDGWVSPIISQGLKYGTFIPLRNSIHGYAIAVLHTHPVPRTAPSIADLNLLFSMSMFNTPVYLGTIYRGDDEVTLTLYIANRRINPVEARAILSESYVYEVLNIEGGFKEDLSDKQIYEQQILLQKFGISIERYRFKL